MIMTNIFCVEMKINEVIIKCILHQMCIVNSEVGEIHTDKHLQYQTKMHPEGHLTVINRDHSSARTQLKSGLILVFNHFFFIYLFYF